MSVIRPMVEGPVELVKLELLQPGMTDVAKRIQVTVPLMRAQRRRCYKCLLVAERRCQALAKTRAGTERRVVSLTRRQRCRWGLRITMFRPEHAFL